MLNNDQIKRAIIEGKIEVFYSFIKDNVSIIETEGKVDLDKTNDVKTKFFSSNLYSERLKLTLGPIIKSHQRKRVKNKIKFKNYDCIDIRKNGNRYIILPKETITVLTNEFIGLSGDIAAIILPRVSFSEIGLSLTPAYIDPFYKGISRLLISNVSNKPIELNFLDVIAQCYFFRLDSAVDIAFKEDFPQKSVFYGHNWSRLLKEDVDPFPTRKKYVRKNKFLNDFLVQFDIIRIFLKENAFIASIITVFIISLVGYGSIKDKFDRMTKIADTFDGYKRTVDSLSLVSHNQTKVFSNLVLRKSELKIDKINLVGEKTISLQIPKEDIITVFINANNENGISIEYSLKSGDSPSESKIFFLAKSQNKLREDIVINFEYSILTVYNAR